MSELRNAVCPFFMYERGTGTVRCELCKFYFPDKESKEQIKTYCCDMSKYEECTLYKIMNAYYERKYKEGV